MEPHHECNVGNVKTRKFDSLSSLIFHEMDETRRLLISKFTKYSDRVTMDSIRPLPVFLGMTGTNFCLAPHAFNPPSTHIDKDTAEKYRQRMDLNIAFFISNYALISIGTCIIVILLHPKMVIFCGLLYSVWKAHNAIIKHDIPLIVIDHDVGKYVTIQVRKKILYFMTFWVVVFFCLKPFILAFGLSFMMVLFHAIMRDPKHTEKYSIGTISHPYTDQLSDEENDDSSGSEVLVDKV